MKDKNLIVLGINADIGSQIAERYAIEGFRVLGTYRRANSNCDRLTALENIELFQCDIMNADSVTAFCTRVSDSGFHWTNLFSSIGSTKPIKRFFQCDIDKWIRSFHLNFTSQLAAIHKLFPFRSQTNIVSINFMAGGGTNSAMVPYSAYCSSKIALIKACELLDAEEDSIKVQILGPGLVRTRIHQETIEAAKNAEDNFHRIRNFLNSTEPGSTYSDIYECLRWLDKAPKEIVGGRNFSLVHDRWGELTLMDELKNDPNKFRLRRSGND